MRSRLAGSVVFSVGLVLSAGALGAPCQSFTLVVHGGAGGGWGSPATKRKYEDRIKEILVGGRAILARGGAGLDAVQKVVMAMEDGGFLNAGKGAVRTAAGTVELDASLMDGKTQKAGAVASLTTIKNPIAGARLVMDRTWHVLMAGPSADAFLKAEGLATVPPSYFKEEEPDEPRHEYGTVGAVALDCDGNLAAATSTGGLSGKRPGRVGDSPIIGAGTWASNDTVAVSSTGSGEYFIRTSAARDVAAQVEYLHAAAEAAGRATLAKIKRLGGSGGFIIVSRRGEIATPFNTEGMLRGWVRGDADPVAHIDPVGD